MKIIEKYSDSILRNDIELQTRFAKKQHYPVGEQVLNFLKNLLSTDIPVVAYSGSWRLPIDAIFIEESYYKKLDLNFCNKKTLFIDHSNLPVLKKTLKSIGCKNLVFLHSSLFNYKSVDDILKLVNEYKQLFPNIKITSVLHITSINFHRLNTDIKSLELLFNGTCVENSIVFSI